MSGYFYKNVNIGYLVENGSTPVPNYGGFPQSTPYQYSSKFDKPANFSYTIGTTDVSNYSRANYTATYNNSPGSIPLAIPYSPGYYFKSVSVCGCGGGGGGGGGGQASAFWGGGDGGDGGDGSYAAILNFEVPSGTTNISYSIGSGGPGGSWSGNGPGGDGDKGGTTTVSITPTNIINCQGGNGGNGGEATPGNKKGSTAPSGNTPNGSIAPGYTGVISVNAPTYSTYPPRSGNYAGPATNNGGGGGGGNSAKVPASGNQSQNTNSGASGNAGFILVYFAYE